MYVDPEELEEGVEQAVEEQRPGGSLRPSPGRTADRGGTQERAASHGMQRPEGPGPDAPSEERSLGRDGTDTNERADDRAHVRQPGDDT